MPEANKDLVRHFYAGIDAKRYDVYDEVCAPTFKSHLPGAPEPQNIEQRKAFTRMFHVAFPDAKHSLDDIVSEGDTVAARLVVRGTHMGEFMGIAATGKAFEFSAMRFYKITDGKLTEEWINFDSLGLVRHLGGS